MLTFSFSSAGFTASLSYADGKGETSEYDGATYTDLKTTVGHDVLGITKKFERGAAGFDGSSINNNDQHADFMRTDKGRKQTIDDLIDNNEDIIHWELETLLEMHQTYRAEKQQKRIEDEESLTSLFWPEVYNHPNWTREHVNTWVTKKTSHEFNIIFKAQVTPLQYLW